MIYMFPKERDAEEREARIEITMMRVKQIGEYAVHADDPTYFNFNAKAELDIQSSYLATEPIEFRIAALSRFETSLIDRTDGPTAEEVAGFNRLRETLVPTMAIVANDILSKRSQIRKDRSLAPSLEPNIRKQEEYLAEFPPSVHRLYINRLQEQSDHLQAAKREQIARMAKLQRDSETV